MRGLFEANHFISRDEGIHLHVAGALYEELDEKDKLSESEIAEIIKDAVRVEHTFAENTMPLQQMGMNQDVIKRYVNNCANYVAQLFGIQPLFTDTEVPNFCSTIGLATKANFSKFGKQIIRLDLRECLTLTRNFKRLPWPSSA